MTDTKRELARLGPYVFTEGLFDPATDTLRLGRHAEGLPAWSTPQGDQVFTDAATGDVVGLVVYHYQDRLWDGPIEIALPLDGGGRTLFLSLGGNPGSMCC